MITEFLYEKSIYLFINLYFIKKVLIFFIKYNFMKKIPQTAPFAINLLCFSRLMSPYYLDR